MLLYEFTKSFFKSDGIFHAKLYSERIRRAYSCNDLVLSADRGITL